MRTFLGAVLAMLPAAASACPVCARDGTPRAALFIGAMVLLAVRRGLERRPP